MLSLVGCNSELSVINGVFIHNTKIWVFLNRVPTFGKFLQVVESPEKSFCSLKGNYMKWSWKTVLSFYNII